jgi:hypothetical protein
VTSGEGVSTLQHLAEMDRMLREIQVELAPDREPAPPLESAPPSPPPAPPPLIAPESGLSSARAVEAAPDPQLRAFSQLAARLLASMRELLDGYEQFLVPIPSVTPPPPPPPPPVATTTRPPARPAEDPGVTVAAGPFASLEAVRAFEQAVSRLPGVQDVAVRGYEGSDRAIIEVRLDRKGGA